MLSITARRRWRTVAAFGSRGRRVAVRGVAAIDVLSHAAGSPGAVSP